MTPTPPRPTPSASALRRWPLRLVHGLVFVVYFLLELVRANLRVARAVLSTGSALHPAIVRVPSAARTTTEVTMLANAITMTPGTLTLEVDPDTFDLYVHGLDVRDLEVFRAGIARTERLLLKAMR